LNYETGSDHLKTPKCICCYMICCWAIGFIVELHFLRIDQRWAAFRWCWAPVSTVGLGDMNLGRWALNFSVECQFLHANGIKREMTCFVCVFCLTIFLSFIVV